MYGQLSKRWGEQQEDLRSIDLLAKKDQQIRRLQAELQQQRRRTESALKMLESFKNISNQSEQASQGLRSEIVRRMRAQQEVKKLKNRNEQLEKSIKMYLEELRQEHKQKREKYFSVPDETDS